MQIWGEVGREAAVWNNLSLRAGWSYPSNSWKQGKTILFHREFGDVIMGGRLVFTCVVVVVNFLGLVPFMDFRCRSIRIYVITYVNYITNIWYIINIASTQSFMRSYFFNISSHLIVYSILFHLQHCFRILQVVFRIVMIIMRSIVTTMTIWETSFHPESCCNNQLVTNWESIINGTWLSIMPNNWEIFSICA